MQSESHTLQFFTIGNNTTVDVWTCEAEATSAPIILVSWNDL